MMKKKLIILTFLLLTACPTTQTLVPPIPNNPSSSPSTVIPTAKNNLFLHDKNEYSLTQVYGSLDISVNKISKKGIAVWYKIMNEKLNIYGRLLDEELKPVGSEFKINNNDLSIDIKNTPSAPLSLKADINKNGDFVVAWKDKGISYVRLFDKDAVPKGIEFIPYYSSKVIESYISPSNYLFEPIDVKINNEGDFLVQSNEISSSFQLYFQDGRPKGILNLNSNANLDKMVMQPDGNFIVIQKKYIIDKDRNVVQRYDKNGSPIGESFILPVYFLESYSVDIDNTGNFLIAGVRVLSNDGSPGRDFYALRYTSSYQLINEFKVNESVINNTFQVSATLNDSGNMVFAWTEPKDILSNSDIFVRRFNKSGVTSEKPFKANYFIDGIKNNPKVNLSNENIFVVSWFNYNLNNEKREILYRRYNIFDTAPYDDQKLIQPENVDCSNNSINKNDIYTGELKIQIQSGEKFVDYNPDNLSQYNELTKGFSGVVTINNNQNFIDGSSNLADGVLMTSYVKPKCVQDILNLYGIQSYEYYSDSLILKLDFNKIKPDDIENLIRRYSKIINSDIKDIKFTSVQTLKTYYIYLQLKLNYPHIFKSVYFESLGSTG